ncbi:MAG: aminopeptidase [Promethearchaeota archaeon]
MAETRMMIGAKKILDDCVSLRASEIILIITDTKLLEIAQVLVAAVNKRNAEPVLIVMKPLKRDGQEPPILVSEAMKHADIILIPVSKSITHTKAVKLAAEAGARILVMTAFTERLMMSGGIEADFKAQKPICEKLGELFTKANTVHLTTKAGTDLTMNIEGQKGNALTCIVEPGMFSTIPTIEANVSPLVGSSEGQIVVDASIPYINIGLLSDPVNVTVKKGFIKGIQGGYQAELLKKDLEAKNDPNVYNIAELGVGLNPKSQMTGVMLDDEGVLGSCHIGIGTNLTLGGSLKAAVHYDLVLWKPTIELDGIVIIKNGELKFL